MEYDVQEIRSKTCKIIRRLEANFTEKVKLPEVDVKEAVRYYSNLWTEENRGTWRTNTLQSEEADIFTMEDLRTTLKSMKTRKSASIQRNAGLQRFKYATNEVQKSKNDY